VPFPAAGLRSRSRRQKRKKKRRRRRNGILVSEDLIRTAGYGPRKGKREEEKALVRSESCPLNSSILLALRVHEPEEKKGKRRKGGAKTGARWKLAKNRGEPPLQVSYYSFMPNRKKKKKKEGEQMSLSMCSSRTGSRRATLLHSVGWGKRKKGGKEGNTRSGQKPSEARSASLSSAEPGRT